MALGQEGLGSPGKGSRGPVLPECRGAPSFPRKRPVSWRGKVAVPSLGGVIYGRGWRQRKSLTEGKGTGDLHLREKGEKLPSLSSVRGQPANPWVSPLAAAGLRDGLRREASLPCPPGPRRERRMSEDGHSSRGGGVSASTLPCSPRHRGAGQAALSAHIPGARFPSAAWPPRTTALNEIL